MFSPSASTDKLHATAAVGSADDGGLPGKKRKIRPICELVVMLYTRRRELQVTKFGSQPGVPSRRQNGFLFALRRWVFPSIYLQISNMI